MLVTPAQAQIVTLASQLGTIRLILRSGEDSEQPKTVAMTAHELLGAFGGGDRAKENPDEASEKRFLEWAEQMRKTMREDGQGRPRQSRRSRCSRSALPCGCDGWRMGRPNVNDVLLINNSGVQGLPGDEGAWTATGMGPSSHGKADGDPHGSKPVEIGPRRRSPAGPAAPPKSATDSVAAAFQAGKLRGQPAVEV